MERGTLCQLRNLINRRNVTKKPKKNVNAAEDFLEVVITGHILTAVMSCLGMSSLKDMPLSSVLSHDLWMQDDEVRRKLLNDIALHVVNQHVDLAIVFKDPSSKETPGTAYDYACEVLTLGLFIMNFKDAVRGGDGEHVLLLWKFMLLIFKATGRKNYALEALTLLSQYYILIPPNLAEQLKWSRFINIHGCPGHNISCDLHMEHINKVVKVVIEGLRANKSEKSIKRVAKAIGETTESFDSEVGLVAPSGKHSDKAVEHNKSTATRVRYIQLAIKNSICIFYNSQKNVVQTLDEKTVKEWMIVHFSKIMKPGFSALVTDHDENSDIDDNEDD